MKLTPRQEQLVELLCSDHTVKESAWLMRPRLTEASARAYLSQARARMNVRTTYALIHQLAISKQGT